MYRSELKEALQLLKIDTQFKINVTKDELNKNHITIEDGLKNLEYSKGQLDIIDRILRDLEDFEVKNE